MLKYLSKAQYGTLYTLIALMNVLGVASTAIQMVTAQKISASLIHGEIIESRKIFRFILARTILSGMAICIIYTLLIPFLQIYLQINSSILFYIVGATLFLSFIYPVVIGTLQGVQNFIGFGLNGIISSFGRLVIGISLVFLAYGEIGALLSFPGFFIISIILGLFMLKDIVEKKEVDLTDIKTKNIFGHIISTIAALLLYSIICNFDTFIVKHYFSKSDTGLYSAVSLFGKAFLFIPVAFTQVMFPKVSGEHVAERNTKHLLDKTVLYGLLMCLLGSVICFTMPEFILGVVGKQKYIEGVALLKYFPLAITPLALSNIFLNYQLARLKIKFILSFLIVTVLHMVLLLIFHNTFYQIIFVIGFSGSLIFIWNYYMAIKEVKR